MADLVTHMCTALLPGALFGRRWVGPVLLGTVLPDLAARVTPLGLELVHRLGLLTVPDPAMFIWGILHEPSGLLLLCLICSYLVREPDRLRFLGGLLLGCALHLGLDITQDHHGQGYMLLAPFSRERFELGWIGSEATVRWAPWLAGLTALAWAVRIRLDRRRPAGRPSAD